MLKPDMQPNTKYWNIQTVIYTGETENDAVDVVSTTVSTIIHMTAVKSTKAVYRSLESSPHCIVTTYNLAPDGDFLYSVCPIGKAILLDIIRSKQSLHN